MSSFAYCFPVAFDIAIRLVSGMAITAPDIHFIGFLDPTAKKSLLDHFKDHSIFDCYWLTREGANRAILGSQKPSAPDCVGIFNFQGKEIKVEQVNANGEFTPDRGDLGYPFTFKAADPKAKEQMLIFRKYGSVSPGGQ